MRKGIALGLVLILLLTLSGCAGKQEPAGEKRGKKANIACLFEADTL